MSDINTVGDLPSSGPIIQRCLDLVSKSYSNSCYNPTCALRTTAVTYMSDGSKNIGEELMLHRSIDESCELLSGKEGSLQADQLDARGKGKCYASIYAADTARREQSVQYKSLTK